jgi:hypothetical protein
VEVIDYWYWYRGKRRCTYAQGGVGVDGSRGDKVRMWTDVPLQYLSVIISHNKVEMDPVEIAGVVDWPTPSNKKEVQSFIGFINFYQ